ncbi:MAG: molecular chaperone HtpG [Candidatus Gracilibacteria bacterium]|nr:molecular chaperone HtpG [Candidatus Gracilibacteria bacterium]
MSKHNFEAETGRILELLTHSIYSNKEIFLRELISNCADAIDKARLKSLTDTTFLGDDSEFKITVEADKNNKTITITDNGIGMTGEELISHLGTIAKSGTKEFIDKLKKAKEDSAHNLIGQFGVGFYSSFMVADSVEVESKSGLDTKAHRWTSDGKSDYDIVEIEKETRGTKIILHINEANISLLDDWKLKELIKKYSNYVGVPIMMRAYDSRTDEEKAKEPKIMDFEQVNETKPIWKKDKKDITKEEYKNFYQSISSDWNEPLFTIHNNVEGMVSYKSILFAPSDVNMYKNLSDPNQEFGPRLYVQNVLILENAKELIPVWLRFISGVVETSDLPLNISREMLQENTILDKIKKGLTKKVISEFENTLKNKKEDYIKFWSNYGKVVKEGIHYEYDLKQEIAGISLFKGINNSELITLDEYLEKAPAKKEEVEIEGKKEDKVNSEGRESDLGQKEIKTIYYIIAKSENEALASPYISQFKEKNIDVLVLTDAIDSFLVQSFNEFKEAKLVSITSNDIELEEKTPENKKQEEEKKVEFKSLFELIKSTIGDEKIEEVVLNDKLGTALGALKTPKNGIDPQLEKMMKAMGQTVPKQKRILELNSKNSLVDIMKKEFDSDVKSEKLTDTIKYAYYQAILLEGGEVENIKEFVELTNKFASSYLK